MPKDFISVYYIGLNDKDEHKQIYTTSTSLKIIQGCLSRNNVTEYTSSEVVGSYQGEKENTIKIELFNDKLSSRCIKDLKEVLNQECIAEVITECNIKFI